MIQDFPYAVVYRLLRYEPEAGKFYWKVNRPGRPKAGDEAGWENGNGYIKLSINGIQIGAHRIAWLLTYGYIPREDIDHIDGNPSNNRISNLRLASGSVNHRNAKRRKDNTSGCCGVSRERGRWVAQIMNRKKQIFLGRFEEWWDAVCARKAAENLHGFHPNHGRII